MYGKPDVLHQRLSETAWCLDVNRTEGGRSYGHSPALQLEYIQH